MDKPARKFFSHAARNSAEHAGFEAAVVKSQAMEGRSGFPVIETTSLIDLRRGAAIMDDRTINPRRSRSAPRNHPDRAARPLRPDQRA